jgi:hypothetical protein
MTKSEIQTALKGIIEKAEVDTGELRRIFARALCEHEKKVGWDAPNKNGPWTDEQLRVVLSDPPTEENGVKHAKAFGRGYGSIEQSIAGPSLPTRS